MAGYAWTPQAAPSESPASHQAPEGRTTGEPPGTQASSCSVHGQKSSQSQAWRHAGTRRTNHR
eukprot:13322351-Alexandrium_andersonii.AAC.1